MSITIISRAYNAGLKWTRSKEGRNSPSFSTKDKLLEFAFELVYPDGRGGVPLNQDNDPQLSHELGAPEYFVVTRPEQGLKFKLKIHWSDGRRLRRLTEHPSYWQSMLARAVEIHISAAPPLLVVHKLLPPVQDLQGEALNYALSTSVVDLRNFDEHDELSHTHLLRRVLKDVSGVERLDKHKFQVYFYDSDTNTITTLVVDVYWNGLHSLNNPLPYNGDEEWKSFPEEAYELYLKAVEFWPAHLGNIAIDPEPPAAFID